MSIWVVFTFYFSRTFAFDQYWCFHWLGNPALKFYSVMFGNCVQSRGIVYISPGKITSNDKLPSNKKVTRIDLEKTKNISAWLFFCLELAANLLYFAHFVLFWVIESWTDAHLGYLLRFKNTNSQQGNPEVKPHWHNRTWVYNYYPAPNTFSVFGGKVFCSSFLHRRLSSLSVR